MGFQRRLNGGEVKHGNTSGGERCNRFYHSSFANSTCTDCRDADNRLGPTPPAHPMRMASLIVSFLLVVPTFAVDPKELKPGLIATYTEFVDGKPAATTHRLDPQPAFFLSPD